MYNCPVFVPCVLFLFFAERFISYTVPYVETIGLSPVCVCVSVCVSLCLCVCVCVCVREREREREREKEKMAVITNAQNALHEVHCTKGGETQATLHSGNSAQTVGCCLEGPHVLPHRQVQLYWQRTLVLGMSLTWQEAAFCLTLPLQLVNVAH
jgi:hypothetical protein